MALTKDKKANIISEYARSKTDTGSVEVQVAMLTEKINRLTDHMIEHKHDYHTKLGLQKMVGKRKKLLSYLKDEDVARYRELIKKLNLRK